MTGKKYFKSIQGKGQQTIHQRIRMATHIKENLNNNEKWKGDPSHYKGSEADKWKYSTSYTWDW